ncbi:MAG: hypothetical protein R2747_04255 [Pyrinomonadaceae bacterium]
MTFSSSKSGAAETQALQISDLFQEARQRALSQRTTHRVEINATKRVIRLIDELGPGDASDDKVIKFVNYSNDGVYIGSLPSNASGSPTELSPVPVATFASSTHPLSAGDFVATFRFIRNGTVTNAGTNGWGSGAVVTGATVYVWSKYPNDGSANPSVGNTIRAVTVLGSTGLTRMWKCNLSGTSCSNWTK